MTYSKEKPSTIQSMFDSVALKYDLTNGVLSFWLHKLWNRHLVKSVAKSDPEHVYMDLCSGTGEIAFDYLKQVKSVHSLHLVDFSEKMLDQAKEKGQLFSKAPLFYWQADVQELPFSKDFADVATMAYGIRNVKNPSACLKDVFRVLKPGGVFAILELTRPKNPCLKFGHSLYLHTLLPLLGKVFTHNKEAYKYLCNSIDHFISPEELESIFQATGFENTSVKSLWGGIATIITGHKPYDT